MSLTEVFIDQMLGEGPLSPARLAKDTNLDKEGAVPLASTRGGQESRSRLIRCRLMACVWLGLGLVNRTGS